MSDNPTIMGMESAIRLLRLWAADERVARYRAERESASVNLELASLQQVLYSRASRTGEGQMPLNADGAERFFKEKDAK